MPSFLPALVDIAPGLVAGFACNGRGIALTTALGVQLANWAQGRALADLPLPSGPVVAIAMHALTQHAPKLLLPLSRLRDRLDRG
jgi:glycine/D-amino acid oxidase-like deaminating enzyme